jgi:hypothetical protein
MMTRLGSSLCAVLAAFVLAWAGASPAGATPRGGSSCCGAFAPCAEGDTADCPSLLAMPCCEVTPSAAATRAADAKSSTAPPLAKAFAAALAPPARRALSLPNAPIPKRPPLRSVVLQL